LGRKMGLRKPYVFPLLCLLMFGMFASLTPGSPRIFKSASADQESSWEPVGPDGGDMHFVFVTSTHSVIASHGLGGVWRSTDGGATWKMIRQPDLVDVGFLSMDEADGVLLAGGNAGIWVSTDDGKSWERVTTGIPELDGTPSVYEVVSIVAVNGSHFYASVRVNPAAHISGGPVQPFEGVFEVLLGEGSPSVVEHVPPFPSDGDAVVTLDYDPDFHGSPTLFVSSSVHGLYMVRSLDSSWSWELVLDKWTTRVAVDRENDVVYVGTLNEWFWRGEFTGSSWSWDHIVPKNVTGTPIACFIKPDPYDQDRLWWGTVDGSRGSPYKPLPETSGPSLRGVGKWDALNDRWLHCFKSRGWGSIIAIDHHQPGENPDDYRLKTPWGYAAKYAFVPGGGADCVCKTEDGGRTWKRSYDGVYGDTMNEVVFIEEGVLSGHLVAICVSGIQISPDYGDSWLPDVDFQIFGVSPTERAGYAWGAASPPERTTVAGLSDVDLFIATGYPPTDFTGNGLYAVSLSGGPSFVRLTSEPVHEIVQVGWVLVLALESGGVRVYHVDTGSTYLATDGFPTPAPGVFELAHRQVGGVDWWFASTYEGVVPPDSDSFFYDGPGSIYRAKNVTSQGENASWELVYTSRSHRAVAVSLSSSGEMLALLSNGELLYTPDFTAQNVSWTKIKPTFPGEATRFTDLEVDWESRVVFISTFQLGVLYAPLDNLLSSPSGVELQEMNDGLMTRNVRNLLLVKGPKNTYLFAGTQGGSVWRLVLELEEAGQGGHEQPPEEEPGQGGGEQTPGEESGQGGSEQTPEEESGQEGGEQTPTVPSGSEQPTPQPTAPAGMPVGIEFIVGLAVAVGCVVAVAWSLWWRKRTSRPPPPSGG